MPSPSPIAARLERLAVGKFHYRFISLVSLGEWFDMYDLFMVAYVGAALQNSGFLSLQQFSEFVAAGFLGMFLGTVLFGMTSDYMGRRTSFVAMLLIYSAFTFFGSFARSAMWLITCRFLAGIGMGAEIVVIDTYVSEMMPSYARGRFVAITQVVGFTSVPFVAIVSRFLVPTHFLIGGWRWVMLIGAAGALLAWYLRLSLPESPRWLESVNRIPEAQKIVEELEELSRAAGEEGRKTIEDDISSQPLAATVASTPQLSRLSRFREIWDSRYRNRTIMLIVFQTLQTVGFYGFANWAPTFLLKRGIGLLHSLDYSLVIALIAPAGPLIASFTADRLERKWTISALALAIAAFGLGFAVWRSPAMIVMSGAMVTLSSNWFSAVLHSYQSELFPTRIRATGVGFTYSWSRLSAALSSFLIAAVLTYGVTAVFSMLAVAMVGVATAIAFGPRTNRRGLEELSA